MPKGVYAHKPRPLCCAPGCSRVIEIRATQLCFMHHRRLLRNGSFLRKQRQQAATCCIDGCICKTDSLDMCTRHYTLLKRYGDPLHKRTMRLETREKISATLRKRGYRPSPTALRNSMKVRLSPTCLEHWMIDLIAQRGLPFRYCGNGDVFIGNRCPDFINVNGKKQVIEVFGRWWHDPQKNPRVLDKFTERAIREHYNRYGFECLIFWEEELKGRNKDDIARKISGVIP